MKIPFFYDYTCPWAYIGSVRVEAYFTDQGVSIDFRPVYLKQMKEPMVGPEPTGERSYGPRKARYYAQLRNNWAECCGAEFGDPERLVRADTALLLKGALVAQDEQRFREYHYPAYRARWVDGDDVSQRSVVHGLLERAGLDADACLEKARSPELDQRLSAVTEDAMTLGVFGIPTIVVADRVIWGNDQFEMTRYFVEQAKQSVPA
jgi:2-hydroxychromene-2-carboxylate isomerase